MSYLFLPGRFHSCGYGYSVQLQQVVQIFFIAFATALANGKQPEKLKFIQDKMREQCLISGELTMFPVAAEAD